MGIVCGKGVDKVPIFYFAIATGSMDNPNNTKWDPSERCFMDYQF